MKTFLLAVLRWVGDISPTCKRVAQLQSKRLDQLLPRRERFGLWMHLCLCKWCRRYGRQISFLRDSFHKCDEEHHQPDSPELSPEARERIKRALSRKS